MIKRDKYGYIVDTTYEDGGDSANRAGLTSLFGFYNPPLTNYVKDGICVRHPHQVPWNNPKNFTHDQLIPLVAGLWKQKHYQTVRHIMWKHIMRFGFCQNFERDYIGSKKYPWPHSFINDRGVYEKRHFDFADPLRPDSFWHLVLCGRAWYFYWFAPIGYAWLLLSIFIYCWTNRDDDEGQIISQCVVAGKPFVYIYKKLRTNVWDRLYQYWHVRRDQREIADLVWKGINQ